MGYFKNWLTEHLEELDDEFLMSIGFSSEQIEELREEISDQ